MSDETQTSSSNAMKLNSSKVMGGLVFCYGIALLIIFVIEGYLGHTIISVNMDAWSSVAVVFLPLAALFVVSGYLMIKNSKIGYYIVWIAALISIVLGMILAIDVVKNTIFMDYFLLIAGVSLIPMLLSPATREGLH